jgi:hypothetical protein
VCLPWISSEQKSLAAKSGSSDTEGKIQILDIDWWKPMSDDEAGAFVEGRD